MRTFEENQPDAEAICAMLKLSAVLAVRKATAHATVEERHAALVHLQNNPDEVECDIEQLVSGAPEDIRGRFQETLADSTRRARLESCYDAVRSWSQEDRELVKGLALIVVVSPPDRETISALMTLAVTGLVLESRTPHRE